MNPCDSFHRRKRVTLHVKSGERRSIEDAARFIWTIESPDLGRIPICPSIRGGGDGSLLVTLPRSSVRRFYTVYNTDDSKYVLFITGVVRERVDSKNLIFLTNPTDSERVVQTERYFRIVDPRPSFAIVCFGRKMC